MLDVLGGFLVGMAVGCGGVAGYVLFSEGGTTNRTKRYIESGIAAASLVVGIGLLLT